MIYKHPENNHTYVRVMPGKPHSPWPQQQLPYVVHLKNGQYLDALGNVTLKAAPEAHIPINQFKYHGD